MDILTEINSFTENDIEQNLFNKSIDFVLNIKLDKLHAEQLDKLLSIINKIESSEENILELKRAKKSLSSIKQYARAYYRKRKISLKARKKKIEKSASGRKRARAKDRMARAGKTPSGRRKVIYNTIHHVN